MSIKDRVTDNQLNELVKICVLWNSRLINPSKAMSQIWKLFKQENLAVWSNPKKIAAITSEKRSEK